MWEPCRQKLTRGSCQQGNKILSHEGFQLRIFFTHDLVTIFYFQDWFTFSLCLFLTLMPNPSCLVCVYLSSPQPINPILEPLPQPGLRVSQLPCSGIDLGLAAHGTLFADDLTLSGADHFLAKNLWYIHPRIKSTRCIHARGHAGALPSATYLQTLLPGPLTQPPSATL